jgi:hypothetical protein
VAPEPAWEKPPFNREKFLLWCIGWILGVQFGIFILAGLMCSYGYLVKANKISTVQDELKVCPDIADKIQNAAGESLAVLLALLGGGAMVASDYQRRVQSRPPAAPPDPRTPRR